MTLWTFCQSVLLVFNAFAVLNEQRFLEKAGLGHSSLTSGYVSATSPRGQLIGLITATTYMRSEWTDETLPPLSHFPKRKGFLSRPLSCFPTTRPTTRPVAASDTTRRPLYRVLPRSSVMQCRWWSSIAW
jgi:hypothetical protein